MGPSLRAMRDMRVFNGVVGASVVLPLLAYLTIERPAVSFSVKWALFLLLLGSGVIVASGWFQRERPQDPNRLYLIAGLNVVGLIIAYIAGNWWMSAIASFTALISLVFAYPRVEAES